MGESGRGREGGSEGDLLLKSSEFGFAARGRVNERLMDGWREHIAQTPDATMRIYLFLQVIKRTKRRESRRFLFFFFCFFSFLVAKDVHTVWPQQIGGKHLRVKGRPSKPGVGEGPSQAKNQQLESSSSTHVPPSPRRPTWASVTHHVTRQFAAQAHIPSITSLLISHFPRCPKQKKKIDLCQIIPVDTTPQSALPFSFLFLCAFFF